jgi:hypothetical protein
MQTRYIALALGVIYLVVGIIGFIPALYTSPPAGAPHVDATAAYGLLFGLFPVNALHDVLHIVVGLAGILCYASLRASRYYGRILFLVFGLLTVAGFMPTVNTLNGLVPLYSGDTWLHAATALVGAIAGWVTDEETELEPAIA